MVISVFMYIITSLNYTITLQSRSLPFSHLPRRKPRLEEVKSLSIMEKWGFGQCLLSARTATWTQVWNLILCPFLNFDFEENAPITIKCNQVGCLRESKWSNLLKTILGCVSAISKYWQISGSYRKDTNWKFYMVEWKEHDVWSWSDLGLKTSSSLDLGLAT